ncbi:hypothetical protein FQV27_05650 [Paracoccus aurantiacus]|uniref:Uncharacterized protein n=1 Tax=Paracoccus aurantiacus TaxID=2599412 RepID=A0A5C6S529_9RHOB|nr:hypothetical protein [Paracoccus aurantiacus]TXB69606.1 hypothetical protein FQV27_05650 [Paracoccus aurantiacus]
MADHNDPADIHQRFLKLRSWDELDQFLSETPASTPFNRALHYYATTWTPFRKDPFDPADLISLDQAAAMYGRYPVIFMGSNQWAEKSFDPLLDADGNLSRLVDRAAQVRAQKPDTPCCVIVVPEKDYVISRLILGEARFDAIHAAMERLGARLQALDIQLIFDQPLRNLLGGGHSADLEFPDSHLSGAHYLDISATRLSPWARTRAPSKIGFAR